MIVNCSLGVATVYLAYTARKFLKEYKDNDYIAFAIFSVLLGLLTIGCIIFPFCIEIGGK